MPKTKIISLVCSLFLSIFSFQRTFAQTETINSGSYVIDLGFQSPIISNSVKQFINAVKVKDGIDFSHNGKNLMVKAIVISA